MKEGAKPRIRDAWTAKIMSTATILDINGVCSPITLIHVLQEKTLKWGEVDDVGKLGTSWIIYSQD